jgi:hypothetical protein
MSAAARATAQAAPAPAPAVHGAAPLAAPIVPRFAASLAALPAAPAIQRRCAACEEKEREETAVQPSLEVGPSGDRYEQEADAIAARVMRMPAGGSTQASASTAVVQRACASCEEEKVRKRGETDAAPDPTPRIAASAVRLTSGGRPLPSHTQSFLEERTGRDLSSVRVHDGAESSGLNRSIQARAFTYENHIWLGAGERPEPTFTMAHEATHVLQQTRPPSVPASSGTLDTAGSDPAVQRSDLRAFWLPAGSTKPALTIHTEMHNAAVEAVGKVNNGVIQEAPMPGGNIGRVGCGVCGFADFYLATPAATIGLEQDCATAETTDPRVQNFDSGSTSSCVAYAGRHPARIGKKSYSHQNSRAPRLDDDGNVIDLAKAPTSIAIGDMKPGHNHGARRDGIDQLDHYSTGIRNVVHATNNVLRPSGRSWSVSPRVLGDTELQIPAGWDPGVPPTKANIKLKLRYRGRDLVPWGTGGKKRPMPVVGRWVIARDTQHDGIWAYFLLPEPESLRKALARDTNKPALKRVAGRLQKDVLDPLLTSPSGTKKARRLPVTPAPPRVQAKKYSDTTFDFATWNRARVGAATDPAATRASVKGEFERTLPEEERDTIEFQAGAVESFDSLGERNEGIKSQKPPLTAALELAGRTLDRIVFWTDTGLDAPAMWIGRLRGMFGDVFVRVAETVKGLKERAARKFSQFGFKGQSGGSTIRRAAMKAGAIVLKTLGGILVDKTVAALVQCLEDGFHKTMTKFVEGTGIEELKQKATDAQKVVQGLADDVLDNVEQLAEKVIGPFRDKVEALAGSVEMIGTIASVVQTMAQGLRIATCLAGGVETMGVACVVAIVDFLLSQFGLSPIDYIAARLVESCQAQRLIAAALVAFDGVAALPSTIANALIGEVRGVLPQEAKDLLCDEAKVAMPSPDEFKCDSFPGTTNDVGKSPYPPGATSGPQGGTPGGRAEKRAEGGGVPGGGVPAGEEPGDAIQPGVPGTQTITWGEWLKTGKPVGVGFFVTSGLELPEQLGTGVERDVRMDIYALGTVFTDIDVGIRVTGVKPAPRGAKTLAVFYFLEAFTVRQVLEDGANVDFSPDPRLGPYDAAY